VVEEPEVIVHEADTPDSSATSFTPSSWPANAVLKLIFLEPKQTWPLTGSAFERESAAPEMKQREAKSAMVSG
jgi:hypothetical protein